MNKPQPERLLSLLDQAMVSGGNFAQSLLLARLLGAETFGSWAAGQLALLFALGLHQSLVTMPMLSLFGRKTPENRAVWRAESIGWQGRAGAVLVLAAAPVGFLFFGKTPLAALVSAAAVWLLVWQDFQRKSLFAEKKWAAACRLDGFLAFCQLAALGWFLIFGGLSLETAWGVWLASYALAVAAGFLSQNFQKKPLQKRLEIRSSRAVALEHWLEGRWLAATSLLQWFAGNGLLAAAGLILGPSALGTARMAQTLVGLLNVLFLALESALPGPAAAAFRAGGWPSLAAFLKKTAWQNGWLAGTFLLAVGLGCGPIFRLAFGTEASAEARLAVLGMAAVYAFSFVGLLARAGLRASGRSRAIFAAYAASSLFTVFAARPLLIWSGFGGLLAGLIGCQIVQLAVFGWSLRGLFPEKKPLEKGLNTSLLGSLFLKKRTKTN